jgi:drug/metabolite transporter (DMT)-like permease
LPNLWVILGLALALIAVWFTASDEKTVIHINELRQPVAAGIAFAAFFVCFKRASGESLLWPLVAVRVVSIVSLLSYVAFTRQRWIPQRSSLVPLVLSGVLDTFGNAFYALAARFGRMDVAAVISSLYPAATVLLAWFILKEKIGRLQTIGIALALAAIIMLSL